MKGCGITPGGGGVPTCRAVGGSQPPPGPWRKNTIWVEGGAAVTDLLFSQAAPSRRSDGKALSGGEVWVETWLDSTAPIEAYRGVKVYPQAVYQYSGGSWVKKDARLYSGSSGTVRPWHPIYFKDGLINAGLTGGIYGTGYYTSEHSNYAPKYGDGVITVTRKPLSSGSSSLFVFRNKVDLTPLSRIYFNASVWKSSKGYSCVGVGKSYGSSNITYTAKLEGTGGWLDVSGLSGEYYIGASAGVSNKDKDSGTSGFTIYEVRGELKT